jgi:lipid II:glycine glycyltransferase (peptidoglycan interpeptide bridge formation enzyme)
MLDLRQTSEYAKYMAASGWQVVQMPQTKYQIFLKKIPFLGTLAKAQRPFGNLDTKYLQDFIKEHKISILSIEPVKEVPLLPNFSYAKSPYLPSKTIQLALNKSETELLKQMRQKTRYNIKIAKKHKVIVKKSSDINNFVELWQKAAAKRGQFLPQKKEIKALFENFGNKAHLYYASKENNPIAGLLILDSQDTAYYMYAFSLKLGRELFAPTLLSWKAIQDAKKRKLKIFDFDGIYDERYPETTKHWRGFTKFKQGFGGKVVEFPRTLIYYKNPILKLLQI